MDQNLWFFAPSALLCLAPLAFLFVGGSLLLALSWLAGSVNRRTVEVTVEHIENRVVNENTINLFSCKTQTGETVIFQNNFSLYGWKFVRKTLAINALIKQGGVYRLTVAGLGWGYGQNIIHAEEI